MVSDEGRLAVGTLFAAYGGLVFRRALKLLGDRDAASDVCQEIFVRVMQLEDSTPLAENAAGWLHRATTNFCLNQLRDSKRRKELLSVWPQQEGEASRADTRVTVLHILREVPDTLKQAALEHYVAELSHAEIARMAGTSRRTIGNRLLRFHEEVGQVLQRRRRLSLSA